MSGKGRNANGKPVDTGRKKADAGGNAKSAPISRGGRKARGKIRIAAGPVRLEATRGALVVGAAAAALLAAVGLVHIGTGSTPIGAEEIVKVLLGRSGDEQTVRIVGEDEIDAALNKISWKSPLARALIKAREGDSVWLNTPEKREQIEILSVEYVRID